MVVNQQQQQQERQKQQKVYLHNKSSNPTYSVQKSTSELKQQKLVVPQIIEQLFCIRPYQYDLIQRSTWVMLLVTPIH